MGGPPTRGDKRQSEKKGIDGQSRDIGTDGGQTPTEQGNVWKRIYSMITWKTCPALEYHRGEIRQAWVWQAKERVCKNRQFRWALGCKMGWLSTIKEAANLKQEELTDSAEITALKAGTTLAKRVYVALGRLTKPPN